MAAAVVIAAPAAQAVAAAQPAATAPAATGHEHHHSYQPFDEIYEGRRIEGRVTSGAGHHDFGFAVFIDGRELHIMPRAHGWISVINHYEVFDSPYDAVRAAVVALRGANLVSMA